MTMEKNEVVEKLWVADTNVLYTHLQEIVSDKKIVLMSSTMREVDKHKTSADDDLRYKARKTNRFIFENMDKFYLDTGDYDATVILGTDYTNDFEDNRILACCVQNGYSLLTGDLNLYINAKAFKIEVVTPDENEVVKDNSNYTGMHKIYISANSVEEENYARIYQDTHENVFNLLTNQYLIAYDKDKPTKFDEDGVPTAYEVIDKLRWTGESHVPLKLPEKKFIKAKNEEQECALDLLLNKDIPIKIVSGEVGSGKTHLGVKMAMYHVLEKGNHAKILTLRQPIGTGVNIGYLKGDKEEKIKDFLKVFHQQMDGGEQEAEILKARGQLEADVPYFIKGQTFTDTFVLVDEAEDLDTKQFKLIGTRLGEHSAITFTGDVKQAEDAYRANNGLARAVDYLKGNMSAGIVVLSEDIRSEASRVFAGM